MTPQTISPQEISFLDATPTTNDIKVTAEGFTKLHLSENILKALADLNFTVPSPIQAEAIPQIMQGNDIIAKAPTGSGKTAAFAIPILEKLDTNPENKNIQALILCPTRELTIQVHREFEKLTKYQEKVSVVSVYGGQQIDKQLNALKKHPQIIVATPGRLMDHLRRGSIRLDFVSMVVLDEADEMLDMGFREDIHTILEDTPVNRQTVLFSATMAKDIVAITKKFQKSPNIVDVTDDLQNIPDIEQAYFEVVEKDKIELLTRLLDLHSVKLALVFCNTKSNVDRVVEVLKTRGYFSDSLHGDMNQAQREKVMRGFRNGGVEILVATDVAGRGIDVKNIEAVFNYDLPRDDEDYIHRIGRTARAGKSGVAFTFVSRKQVQSIKRIERANGVQIHKKDVPTFEEIEIARASNYKNKIKNIIQNEDLSEYVAKIEAMLSDEISIMDAAAALLKLSTKKSGKKINKNIVFEIPAEEAEKPRHRRERNRNFSDKMNFQRRKSNEKKRKFNSYSK
ncbi:MAG: DEAD/DEAH box helicase [Candidatus Gastranaerophilaceae bacterium]